MKKSIFLIPLLTLALIFTGCSDDDITPEPVNEEELITTMKFWGVKYFVDTGYREFQVTTN